MGKRGPKPTPTKLLALRGSWRAKTRQPGEPSLASGIPPRPDYLAPDEQKFWRALVTRLHRAGLLTPVDGETLGRYCVLRSRWLKAVAFVREHGDTYPVRNQLGAIVSFQPFPQTWLVGKLHKELLVLEREFGLTPSARAALGVLTALGEQANGPEDKGKFFKTG